jgi:hypothetical protein
LSNDTEWPGQLMEQVDIDGKWISHPDPNYVWHALKDENGKINILFLYACLGKLNPLGKQFSYEGKDYLIMRESDILAIL